MQRPEMGLHVIKRLMRYDAFRSNRDSSVSDDKR